MRPIGTLLLLIKACEAVFAQPGSAPAKKINTHWDKPAPVSKVFQESKGACAAQGSGGDTATNLRKNRTDLLPAPHDVTWAAINSLRFPAADRSRLSWTSAQLKQIQPFEGVALRVVAYLSHQVKVETEGSGEATNCDSIEPTEVDWHIYLTEKPKQPIGKAVIIETTPRVRAAHHWDNKVLARWVDTNQPVRVSGFLMLDPEHRDVVGTERSTVWEIHPITKIEVCKTATCQESEWADLDTVH